MDATSTTARSGSPPAAADHDAPRRGLLAGPQLFARYAYPPNELGYCGPEDHQALLEYGAAGVVDGGLADLARGFAGAWPYLELIAAATGVGDPLDPRVVEAYWVGSPLLDRIDTSVFGRSLEDRFRARAGRQWGLMEEAIPAGGVPHHSFHVFCVYPWVGLLRSENRGGHPLHVLDRCRIRWGEVVEVAGDEVLARSRPLTWDGRRIGHGPPRVERVRAAHAGVGFLGELRPGDMVTMHWHWVCERLTPSRLARLRTYEARTLTMTNERLAHPGLPAAMDA